MFSFAQTNLVVRVGKQFHSLNKKTDAIFGQAASRDPRISGLCYDMQRITGQETITFCMTIAENKWFVAQRARIASSLSLALGAQMQITAGTSVLQETIGRDSGGGGDGTRASRGQLHSDEGDPNCNVLVYGRDGLGIRLLVGRYQCASLGCLSRKAPALIIFLPCCYTFHGSRVCISSPSRRGPDCHLCSVSCDI